MPGKRTAYWPQHLERYGMADRFWRGPHIEPEFASVHAGESSAPTSGTGTLALTNRKVLKCLCILKTQQDIREQSMPKKSNQIRPDLEQIRVGNRMFTLRDIGPLTRETRNRRGETLKSVSEHLALSIAGLSRIETGQHLPNGALLTRMLRYVFPNTVVHFTDQDVNANYQQAGFQTLLDNLLQQEGLPDADRVYVVNMVEAFLAHRRPQLAALNVAALEAESKTLKSKVKPS